MRRYFISGLLIWVPIWVTIIVFKFLIDFLDDTIVSLPQSYHIPGLGVILTLAIILLTGLLAANFIGSHIIASLDAIIARIPFARTIHTGVKDVMQALIKPDGPSFIKVYLVEYPRPEMWTVAFLTGVSTNEIKHCLGDDTLISLFIPTTPNITAGFLVIVPIEDAIELTMTVDQALKFIISLGVMNHDENHTSKLPKR
jgi:uncharacterized membrane protein